MKFGTNYFFAQFIGHRLIDLYKNLLKRDLRLRAQNILNKSEEQIQF